MYEQVTAYNGAEEGTRTPTSNRPLPPQDSVSTSSTTSAWQEWEDSNPRHTVLETVALPTELHSCTEEPPNIIMAKLTM